MNCKPGDLAVIVRGGTTSLNVGRILRVVGPSTFGDGWWWCKAVGGPLHGLPKPTSTSGSIQDCRLRPIRDPGDDATDETLLWLPSPSTTKETA